MTFVVFCTSHPASQSLHIPPVAILRRLAFVSATDAILFCAAIVVERGFLGENGVRNVGECTGGSFLPSPFVRRHRLLPLLAVTVQRGH